MRGGRLRDCIESVYNVVGPHIIGNDFIYLPELVIRFGQLVSRRRIYAFIHVLAGIGYLERVNKKTYRYVGQAGIPKRVITLDFAAQSRHSHALLKEMEKQGGYVTLNANNRRHHDTICVLSCFGWVRKTGERRQYVAVDKFYEEQELTEEPLPLFDLEMEINDIHLP